jgi:hypothetical protein
MVLILDWLEKHGEKPEMKELIKFAIALSLILGIAGTGFAIENTNSSGADAVIEKPAKKKKPRRSRRRNINPYAGRNRVIRVGKLSRRQVREFYRRMLDIHLN